MCDGSNVEHTALRMRWHRSRPAVARSHARPLMPMGGLSCAKKGRFCALTEIFYTTVDASPESTDRRCAIQGNKSLRPYENPHTHCRVRAVVVAAALVLGLPEMEQDSKGQGMKGLDYALCSECDYA